ncbi:MAG: hypothetical protein SGBAC_003223 [Bacillariaceae sp.]
MPSGHSNQITAESILHHLVRLGSKVTDPIKKRRRKRFINKQMDEIRAVINETSSGDRPTILVRTSSGYRSLQKSLLGDDDTASEEFSSVTDSEYCDDDNNVKMIDQNDLLAECFMGNHDGDETTFVIHFFNEDSPISEEIDDYLETQFFDKTPSTWKYRQVNARLAPLFSKILGIDPDQPNVVAIKDGAMVTKQTELSSPVAAQLERWMATTEIMISAEHHVDDFSDDDDYSSGSSDKDNVMGS